MKFLEINKFVTIYVLDMLGTCYDTLQLNVSNFSATEFIAIVITLHS